MAILHVRWLGSIDYTSAWEVQRRLVQQRREGTIPDTLLLLEHIPPVITLGRATHREHLLVTREQLQGLGIQLVETDRGGDITYHGPGQLVGYPILDLREHGKDVHRYLRRLEEAIIQALRHFGIEAHRKEGLTGVWVGEEKVAAMGIKVSHWVTMHGFALNICPNLSHFDLIVPCGIHDKRVTSLQNLLGQEVTLQEVVPVVVNSFANVFNLQPVEARAPSSPAPL
ncbi:MAG: lipoyl(octanoyl) transferase LipB [Armatimonadota bacterium]